MTADIKQFKQPGDSGSRNNLSEIGVSGLRRNSGHVYEEYLRELQGPRWQRTIKQMSNDAVIGAFLFAIDTITRQVKFSISPASEDVADVEASDFVNGALFEDMSYSWDDTLSEILTCLPWGWSLFEVVYKVRGGEGDDPAKQSLFSDNRIGWRKWAVRSQDTLSRWEFDENGGIQGMWQQDNFRGQAAVLIPIDKSLLFRTQQRKNNPEGVSILRAAYESWYYRRNIARIEAIGIERDLAGLPYLKVPAEILQERSTAYQSYKDILINTRRDEQEGVMLPSERDENGHLMVEFSLLSTGGTRTFDTDKIISRYDHRILASVLSDFIMLGTSSGSYALSSDKTEMFLMAIGTFLESIEGVINRHAIPKLLKLNGFKLEKYPKLGHGSLEKADLGAIGTYIKTLSDAGMLLFPTVDNKLEHRLLEIAGLPEVEVEEAAGENNASF
jgi:hypothetical protein